MLEEGAEWLEIARVELNVVEDQCRYHDGRERDHAAQPLCGSRPPAEKPCKAFGQVPLGGKSNPDLDAMGVTEKAENRIIRDVLEGVSRIVNDEGFNKIRMDA